jgi:putative transcriptional regulator
MKGGEADGPDCSSPPDHEIRKRGFPVIRKLNGKALAEHEDKRDVWQEVLDSVDEITEGGGKRCNMVPLAAAARARLKSGLSQAQFAALLGVSKRTIEQWELGRWEPSGAARTLIKIAESRPEILKEIACR